MFDKLEKVLGENKQRMTDRHRYREIERQID